MAVMGTHGDKHRQMRDTGRGDICAHTRWPDGHIYIYRGGRADASINPQRETIMERETTNGDDGMADLQL